MKKKLMLGVVSLFFININSSYAFVSYSDAPKSIDSGAIKSNTTTSTGPTGTNVSVTDLKSYEKFTYGSESESSLTTCKNRTGLFYTDDNASMQKISGALVAGSDVELKEMLRTLLPKGWHVDKAKEIGAIPLLSWDKGDTFIDILRDVALKNKLSIHVSLKNKKLHILSSCNPANDAEKQIKQLVVTPSTAITEPITKKESKPISIWTISHDKMLRETLNEWGKLAGWQMVWKVRDTDFKITNDGAFNGTFLEALGQLMAAYAEGAAPIAVNSYEGNHVFEVIDHTPYKRNTF